MEIPDFQSIMLPLLEFASDNIEHSTIDTIESLSKKYKLLDEDLQKMLPSGTQSIFYNRVFWAKAHLKMAGLIKNTKRAHFKITQDGINLLNQKPNKINLALLKKIPKYHEHFENQKKEKEVKDALTVSENNENENSLTPEENIEYFYQNIRKTLAQDLLVKIKNSTPVFFERLVVELIVKMGYGGSIKDAGKAIGKTGDEGIDGIVKEDLLGLDTIYIQAKKYNDLTVGSPEIDKFIGALTKKRAKKGIFITTSFFSKNAIDSLPSNDPKIILIDGEDLANYMIDYDLGVNSIIKYDLKKIDNDYFEEV